MTAEFKQELIQLALKYLSASLALDTHINYAVIRSERDFNALQDLPQFKALVSP